MKGRLWVIKTVIFYFILLGSSHVYFPSCCRLLSGFLQRFAAAFLSVTVTVLWVVESLQALVEDESHRTRATSWGHSGRPSIELGEGLLSVDCKCEVPDSWSPPSLSRGELYHFAKHTNATIATACINLREILRLSAAWGNPFTTSRIVRALDCNVFPRCSKCVLLEAKYLHQKCVHFPSRGQCICRLLISAGLARGCCPSRKVSRRQGH